MGRVGHSRGAGASPVRHHSIGAWSRPGGLELRSERPGPRPRSPQALGEPNRKIKTRRSLRRLADSELGSGPQLAGGPLAQWCRKWPGLGAETNLKLVSRNRRDAAAALPGPQGAAAAPTPTADDAPEQLRKMHGLEKLIKSACNCLLSVFASFGTENSCFK